MLTAQKATLLLDEADTALDFIKSNKTELQLTLSLYLKKKKKSDLPPKYTSQGWLYKLGKVVCFTKNIHHKQG